jgi:diacylglycerol kinase family enzyme
MAGGTINDSPEILRKHLFVINPVSFRTRTDIDAFISTVRSQFETVVKAEYDIHVSRFPRDAIRTVRQYIIQAGPETIVRVYAVGGDGILFDCLNGIVGLANAELAPVPYGHTSDFVRAFGEGQEPFFRNILLLAAAPTIPTDILHCGSNYTLNLCAVGLESAANFRSITIQRILKTWPQFIRISRRVYNTIYYLGGFMVLFDKKTMRQEYTLKIDGEDYSGAYASINIANGPCYGGDKNAAITAVPNDGLMDIFMFKGTGTLPAAARILPYSRGYYDRFPDAFRLKRGKVVSIRSDDLLVICLDGEAFLDTNITVELIKGAVKIAAPNNISYKKRAVFHE